MKKFLANIPFALSVPFQLVIKLNGYIVYKLVGLGAYLHMKWQTPLGLRLIETEKKSKEISENLAAVQALSKKIKTQHGGKSDPTLAAIIAKGQKNDPTFH